jgi:hypothetical protein
MASGSRWSNQNRLLFESGVLSLRTRCDLHAHRPLETIWGPKLISLHPFVIATRRFTHKEKSRNRQVRAEVRPDKFWLIPFHAY